MLTDLTQGMTAFEQIVGTIYPGGYKMCLSNVCMDTGDVQKEIMQDVARIEAEGSGFWLINLFGEKIFVEGTIQSIDLVDENLVILNNRKVQR